MARTAPNPWHRYRSLFGWVFVLSLPVLIALHAPLLASEAWPHVAYHAAEASLGASFDALVHVGMATPVVALVGFVVTAVLARQR